mmetsp:Transcript_40089/g.128591  ORF Transcript_40089/g.128591 Transcript_40089/m.128591 type:complete len:336 (+) Transcript_40089:120-1127(+)
MPEMAAPGASDATPSVEEQAQRLWSALAAWAADSWQSGAFSDFFVVALFLAVLAVCVRRRPRTTLAVVSGWLVWFACQLAEGNAARAVALAQAKSAGEKSVAAARAVGVMLEAWLVLILPLFADLWSALRPGLESSWRCAVMVWHVTTWQEKGLATLLTLGVCSAAWAGFKLWRKRDQLLHGSKIALATLKVVLFHLSFVLIGPAIWWLASQLPPRSKLTNVLSLVLLSVFPAVASLRALLLLHQHRQKQQQPASWFDVFRQQGTTKIASQAGFSARHLNWQMRAWLSYWSCWPFLIAVQEGIGFFPSNDMSQAYGLLLALVVWVQFWPSAQWIR